MARTKTETIAPVADSISPETAEVLTQSQNTIAGIEELAKSDLINAIQAITSSKVHRGYEEFSRTNRTLEMMKVKESKAYKALKGVENPNVREIMNGTWEEYCNLLGMSVDKADADIQNIKQFGSEALEYMEKAGMGYRELRQLRKLPDDEKGELIAAAKSGDKDSFLDLAEEIISRNAATKAALQESITELETDHQTQGEILAEAKQENLTLKSELKKLKPGTKMWESSIGDLKTEITNLQTFIDESVARQDEAIDSIDAWLTAHVVNQPGYDPESPFVMPTQAVTVLLHLEDCINRTAHLVAAARHKLHNEFGTELADARRHLLIDSEE